jgi:glutamyl/glutaminyl-tRNA synthetase
LTRVVDDYTFGVEGFTRGADLIGERQLYDHLWRRLYPGGMPARQTYIPVVRRSTNPSKEATGNEAVSIRELRAVGYTARELRETLRECARISALAGMADVVLPADVLMTATRKAIRYRGTAINLAANAAVYAEKPWGKDLKQTAEAYVRGMGWEVEDGPSDAR